MKTSKISSVLAASTAGILLATAAGHAAAIAASSCQQQLTSFTVSARSVVSGDVVTGQVTLACRAGRSGVTVSIAADSPALSVPGSVVVAYGSRTASFSMTAGTVTSAVPVTVTATLGALRLPSTITVNPTPSQGVAVAAVTLDTESVVGGGDPVTATVELTSAAPADTVVYFYGSAYSPVQMSEQRITIPAGQRAGLMQLLPGQVDADYHYTLTGEVRGTAPAAAPLLITPGPFALWLSTTTIARGGSATGTVTLNGGPLSADAVIALASTISGTTVPATVTIPAGSLSASFRFSAAATVSGTGRLQATYGGVTKHIYIATY